MNLFKKKNYIKISPPDTTTVNMGQTPSIPDGMWIKCKDCKKIIYTKEIDEFKICPKCNGHFRMTAAERLAIICDDTSFTPMNEALTTKNPMEYPDYDKVIKKAQEKSGLKEGVVTGFCTIDGYGAVIGVMDSHFMMGSMGSVVGEKVTRAIEAATEACLPLVLFTTSGGARMQEGIISLMQMAKTSAALQKHSDQGLLYVSVLTDPTTGGVSASFAMLGDIILTEPKTLIGFAGQRVIEGTINEKLPEGFQTAEFQLEHGFVDKIVDRRELKTTLSTIFKIHGCKEGLTHE